MLRKLGFPQTPSKTFLICYRDFDCADFFFLGVEEIRRIRAADRGNCLKYIRIWWSELAGAAETLLAVAVEYVL